MLWRERVPLCQIQRGIKGPRVCQMLIDLHMGFAA